MFPYKVFEEGIQRVIDKANEEYMLEKTTEDTKTYLQGRIDAAVVIQGYYFMLKTKN